MPRRSTVSGRGQSRPLRCLRWCLEEVQDFFARSNSVGGDFAKTLTVTEEFNDHDLPGISELRCLDDSINDRHLWEDGDEYEARKNRDAIQPAGILANLSDKCIIRFGSPLESAIYMTLIFVAYADLWLIPFVVSFDTTFPIRRSPLLLFVDTVMQAVFLCGVSAGFFTAFIEPKTIVECRALQAIQYNMLRAPTFWADVAALVSAVFLHFESSLTWLAAFRLMKCWRLQRNTRRVMLLESGNLVFWRIVQIILGLVLGAHMFGCFWFFSTSVREWSHELNLGLSNAGLRSKGMERLQVGADMSVLQAYCFSLRDGTFMLVGWGGPTTVVTDIELAAVMVLSMASLLISVYIQGLFVVALNQTSILEDRFAEKAARLNSACASMHLTDRLTTRICRYHSYLYVNHMDIDAQELFSQLSLNLLVETRVFRMRHLLTTADLFEDLPPRVVFLLVSTCVDQVFAPGDIIVRRGEIGDCMYIILRGCVSVLVDDGEILKKVATLRDHAYFGEICLLVGRTPRTSWVRAESYNALSRLDKDRFDLVVDDHPDMKDMVINRIKEKLQGYSGKAVKDLISDRFGNTSNSHSVERVTDDLPRSARSEKSHRSTGSNKRASSKASQILDSWRKTCPLSAKLEQPINEESTPLMSAAASSSSDDGHSLSDVELSKRSAAKGRIVSRGDEIPPTIKFTRTVSDSAVSPSAKQSTKNEQTFCVPSKKRLSVQMPLEATMALNGPRANVINNCARRGSHVFDPFDMMALANRRTSATAEDSRRSTVISVDERLLRQSSGSESCSASGLDTKNNGIAGCASLDPQIDVFERMLDRHFTNSINVMEECLKRQTKKFEQVILRDWLARIEQNMLAQTEVIESILNTRLHVVEKLMQEQTHQVQTRREDRSSSRPNEHKDSEHPPYSMQLSRQQETFAALEQLLVRVDESQRAFVNSQDALRMLVEKTNEASAVQFGKFLSKLESMESTSCAQESIVDHLSRLKATIEQADLLQKLNHIEALLSEQRSHLTGHAGAGFAGDAAAGYGNDFGANHGSESSQGVPLVSRPSFQQDAKAASEHLMGSHHWAERVPKTPESASTEDDELPIENLTEPYRCPARPQMAPRYSSKDEGRHSMTLSLNRVARTSRSSPPSLKCRGLLDTKGIMQKVDAHRGLGTDVSLNQSPSPIPSPVGGKREISAVVGMRPLASSLLGSSGSPRHRDSPRRASGSSCPRSAEEISSSPPSSGAATESPGVAVRKIRFGRTRANDAAKVGSPLRLRSHRPLRGCPLQWTARRNPREMQAPAWHDSPKDASPAAPPLELASQ